MNAVQLPLAPHNGTATSRIAASMVNVSAQEEHILDSLRAWGGMNQDELAQFTGLLRSAIAARCNRLAEKGLIRKTGASRLTRYGRPACVYEVVS
jgi:predicted transcriptional regulator